MLFRLNSIGLLLIINCAFVLNDSCSKCDSHTQIACLSPNSYQFCKNDSTGNLVLYPEIGTFICPSKLPICDSTNLMRCVDKGTPSCNNTCGICDTATNIACINRKNFAICYNNQIMNNSGYPCPGNLVCNSRSINFCVDPTKIDPTCGDGAIEIPTDPKLFCTSQSNLVLPGRYGIKGECKKYNYCYKFQSTTTGIQLECIGRTNFNCSSHQCEATNCINTC